MEFWELVEQWFSVARKLRGMAQGTVDAYRSDLTDFYRFLTEKGILDMRLVTTSLINQYLVGLVERGLKMTTVHRRKNCLSSFFSYCLEEGQVQLNPVETVRLQKKTRSVRDIVLTDDEVRKFFNQDVSYRTIDKQNQRVLRYLLTFTALRIGEIEKLDWEHVDLDTATISVYDSKNSHRKGHKDNKDRDVPICKSLAAELRKLNCASGPVCFLQDQFPCLCNVIFATPPTGNFTRRNLSLANP